MSGSGDPKAAPASPKRGVLNLSLRGRLTAILIVLSLLPLGISSAVVVTLKLGRMRLDAQEYCVAVSDEAIRTSRSVVEWAGAELQTLGAFFVQRSLSPGDRLDAVRARVLTGRYVRRVALYDAAGRLVDVLREATDPEIVAAPEQLPERYQAAAAASGYATFEPVYPPGALSPQLPMVSLVRQGDSDQPFGYVWTALDLGVLSDELREMSVRRFGARMPDQIYLVDGSQRIVAHPRTALIGTAVPRTRFSEYEAGAWSPLPSAAYASEYEVEGRSVLGVMVPLPELGWSAVIEHPTSLAYRSMRGLVGSSVVLALIFACVALVAGWVAGRRLSRPVLEVAAAAEQVSRGDFAVRVPVSGEDEVAQMGQSFNQMAEALGSYEARVVEETRVRTELGRYLGPELVEGVVSGELDLALGGERREVTVLFADVVAFTPLTEGRQPEQVVAVLNELFTFLTEIVYQQGGIVDKFIGDCVMAVFGAPRPSEEHALDALGAAERMLQWLESGNAKWSKQLGQELQLSIGVASGQVIAGNIGSKKRMEYTVIGDTVNVAAKLEVLARPGQVLTNGRTAELAKGRFELSSLGLKQVKGRREPVEIHLLEEL